MYKICIFCDFYKLGATGSIPAGAFFSPKNDLHIFKSAYLTFFDNISKFQSQHTLIIVTYSYNPNILL